MTTEVFESVWDAPEDTPTEAANMKLRSSLMIAINEAVASWGVTQTDAAKRLGVTQPCLNELLRGRVGKFSLDALWPSPFGRVSLCIWKSRWPRSSPHWDR
jgi:predicted XRE-type DNA-binding protein